MVTDFTGLQFTHIKNDDSVTQNDELCLLDAADGSDDDDDNVCVANDDLLSGSESTLGEGSVMSESLFENDELDVGSFGPDGICFYGEVGCWRDSGVESRMVNALEMTGRTTKIDTRNDEKEEFSAKEAFDDDAVTLEVPEEYDRSPVVQTEEEVFRKVFQFPTARRPVSYRREIKSEVEEAKAAAWFAYLNDLKLYLTRPPEEANLVSLLENGQEEMREHVGEVYTLQGGLRACIDESSNVYWREEARGVG